MGGRKRATIFIIAVATLLAMLPMTLPKCSRALVAALDAERVNTWQELTTISVAQLLAYKGVGTKKLDQLRDGLAARGLTFGLPAKRFTAPIRARLSDVATCGGIYFVRCDRFIKIGLAKDVRARVADLAVAMPFDLTVVRVVACELTELRRREREFHDRFRALRHRGEWFHETGALAIFLADPQS